MGQPDLKKTETESSLFFSVALQAIPLDVTLPCALYVKLADQYILFRESGSVLTLQRALGLRTKGADRLYIARKDWDNLATTFVKGQSGENRTEVENFFDGLQSLLSMQSKKLDEQGGLTNDLLKTIQEISGRVAVELSQHLYLQDRLLREETSSEFFEHHLINVATYSGILGMQMKLPLPTLQLLILGAYLHDIGNQFVPQGILMKRGPLTDGEWKTVKDHTTKGAQILKEAGAPEEVIQVALYHHENPAGTGYPSGLKGDKIPLLARIVNVADVYDALISPRPYHPQLPRKDAIATLQKMSGGLSKK